MTGLIPTTQAGICLANGPATVFTCETNQEAEADSPWLNARPNTTRTRTMQGSRLRRAAKHLFPGFRAEQNLFVAHDVFPVAACYR